MTRVTKYHRIADAIRSQIQAGDLPVGGKLPAETAIAEAHNTTVPTVRQAMSVLRAEGLIESRPGIGTFVRPPLSPKDVPEDLVDVADLALADACLTDECTCPTEEQIRIILAAVLPRVRAQGSGSA